MEVFNLPDDPNANPDLDDDYRALIAKLNGASVPSTIQGVDLQVILYLTYYGIARFEIRHQ